MLTSDGAGGFQGAGNATVGGTLTANLFKAATQTLPYTVIDYYNNQYRTMVVSGAGLVTEADKQTLRGLAGASNADVQVSGTLTTSSKFLATTNGGNFPEYSFVGQTGTGLKLFR